ncbi:failed axon connections homolog [Ylistrum balloti]|uniref:failed axon connections homolog n=1 Tax=Ylistrum balloti TaxID=509963 RepID=UPI002905A120|nr:failed axon connections homolog [Ylistrum balloti]
MALSKVTDTFAELPLSVKVIGGTAVAGTFFLTVWRRLSVRKSERKVYPPDTIVICQIGRGPHVPSLSNFAIKIETYLRLEGIPYQVEHNKFRRSKKTGKIPFIEYNGEEVSDTEFILEFLSKKKRFDLYRGLTSEQIAVGRAFQKMIEENSYWCVLTERWVHEKSYAIQKAIGVPRYLWGTLQRQMKKMVYVQGMGRHTPEEIRYIFSEDLKALSTYIGSKKFLFGEEACKFDCAIFGLLANIYWAPFDGLVSSVIKEYPNLCEYCERMKEAFWPDWEEMIQKDCTR